MINPAHEEKVLEILQAHRPYIIMSKPAFNNLIGALAEAIQDSFDLGFRAAGGTIDDLTDRTSLSSTER